MLRCCHSNPCNDRLFTYWHMSLCKQATIKATPTPTTINTLLNNIQTYSALEKMCLSKKLEPTMVSYELYVFMLLLPQLSRSLSLKHALTHTSKYNHNCQLSLSWVLTMCRRISTHLLLNKLIWREISIGALNWRAWAAACTSTSYELRFSCAHGSVAVAASVDLLFAVAAVVWRARC